MRWKCPECKEILEHILMVQYALDLCEIGPNTDGSISPIILEEGHAAPEEFVCPNCFVHFDDKQCKERDIEFIKD